MTRRIALLLLGLALAGSAAAQVHAIHRTIWVGGDLDISQAVEGPVIALGGNVTVTAPVDGNVRVAGGDVTIAGPIHGDLSVAGGDVRIDGPVTGDASVAAGSLDLGPNARIQGRLRFHGGNLHRDPGAQVAGGIDYRSNRWRHEPTLAWRFTHGWVWTAGLMLLAAVIAGALPGASQRMAQELRERPWITPLLGLLALASIPVGAVLLMLTIIGIPIGLLAIAGYIALLLVAYVWVAVVVGGMLLDRIKPETAAQTAWRVGAAVLAMLALAVLVRMPFLGGLVKLSALAVGVGMIAAAVFRHSPAVESRA